jgi:hypothetical protein
MNQNPLELGWLVDSIERITSNPEDVNAVEKALIELCQRSSREIYALAFRCLQQKWLAANGEEFEPIRWRSRRLITPFGEIELPVRVVRRRGVKRGGYLSLSRVLLEPKATRLLSPAMEKQAVLSAVEMNYRPAARRLSEQTGGSAVSHWLVWKCVQVHGRRLDDQLERGAQPQEPLAPGREPVITELDSGWLKQQHRGRKGVAGEPASGFFMHLCVQYTGRERRWGKRGSKEVALRDKTVWPCVWPMARFGPAARRYRDHHYGFETQGIVMSDGDEGLERMRERVFAGETWLLDRWHVDKRLKSLCGEDTEALGAMRRALYRADSEALLAEIAAVQGQIDAALFAECFGYILGNREGIDSLHQIPKKWRTARGRREPVVKVGTGAVEKNIEVMINRRFKRQGRSWNPRRAGYLAALRWLQQKPQDFNRWWNQNILQRTLSPRTQYSP